MTVPTSQQRNRLSAEIARSSRAPLSSTPVILPLVIVRAVENDLRPRN